MATPWERPPSLLDAPGLGFGTGFTSTGDYRRKVGGKNLSLHPRRVAQRKAKEHEEDRVMQREDREFAKQQTVDALDIRRRQLAAMYAQMGLAPDGTPLALGQLPGRGGPRVNPPLLAPPGAAVNYPAPDIAVDYGQTTTPTILEPPLGPTGPVTNMPMDGVLNPDGTMGFTQPTSPAPPPMPSVAPPYGVPTVATMPTNPYAGLPNIGGRNVPSNIMNLTGPARADAQQADMGLRQSAMASQAMANARAAVAALKVQQEAMNPDPWTRSQVGANIVSTLPGGASVTRAPSGNATLSSPYGTGSATYGAQTPKSFTTVGADGKNYAAPSLDKWKQDQIGERAIGRATGVDADLARGGVAASAAQGRRAFLDQLEQIHQNSLKKKA